VRRAAEGAKLCDVRLKGSSGLDLCRKILERDPAAKVVLLSAYDGERYLFQAVRVAAKGYLLRQITGKDLVRHLERVAEGETVIDGALGGPPAYHPCPPARARRPAPALGSAPRTVAQGGGGPGRRWAREAVGQGGRSPPFTYSVYPSRSNDLTWK
jgi:hypothetical protein